MEELILPGFSRLFLENIVQTKTMSSMVLQRPDLSRRLIYGIGGDYRNLTSCMWTMMSSMSKQYSPEIHTFAIPSNIKKFNKLQQIDHGDTPEFTQFVAREAQHDDEYWKKLYSNIIILGAWLRAESQLEELENERYAENYTRRFAQQEFNAMKKRYNTQLGDNCKCIVMVKNEDRNAKHTVFQTSLVGTLDLSIRCFSHGETFPGECVKPRLFWLMEPKASSIYAYIANLCVAKSARRQGIVTSMLQYTISSAKLHGAEKVFVHVHRNNKPARDLYQIMGFQVVDAARSQPSDELLMLQVI